MKLTLFAIPVLAACLGCLSPANMFLKMGTNRIAVMMDAGIPSGREFLKPSPMPTAIVWMLAPFAGAMILLKRGWDASAVAPIMGLCCVVITFLGKWLLNKPVGALRRAGIIPIIPGVFCVARTAGPAKIP